MFGSIANSAGQNKLTNGTCLCLRVGEQFLQMGQVKPTNGAGVCRQVGAPPVESGLYRDLRGLKPTERPALCPTGGELL